MDVNDLAKGAILASTKGRNGERNGERYVLATEPSIKTGKMMEIAIRSIKMLKSKSFMLFIAGIDEIVSKITGKEPLMMKNQVEIYYNADLRVDISKAKRELGYNPKNPEKAIKETFEYLLKR